MSFTVLNSIGSGYYEGAAWKQVTLVRCNRCGTIIGEDGFMYGHDFTPPKSGFCARHEAICFGEDNQ